MSTLHVLRVFCAEDGTGGNPLGVFLDGAEIPGERRQAVARDLGFSETVFVDDAAGGVVRIFTPTVELPFAGHPMVGTSWLLAHEREPVPALHPPAGEVGTWRDGEDTWIRAQPEWAPPFEFEQHPSPAAVDALEPRGTVDHWAWIDEDAGSVRSRVFAGHYGIAEDEATGAAAVRLVSKIGRPIEIRQGRGSRIMARPGPEGFSEVGGRAMLDEARDYGSE